MPNDVNAADSWTGLREARNLKGSIINYVQLVKEIRMWSLWGGSFCGTGLEMTLFVSAHIWLTRTQKMVTLQLLRGWEMEESHCCSAYISALESPLTCIQMCLRGRQIRRNTHWQLALQTQVAHWWLRKGHPALHTGGDSQPHTCSSSALNSPVGCWWLHQWSVSVLFSCSPNLSCKSLENVYLQILKIWFAKQQSCPRI